MAVPRGSSVPGGSVEQVADTSLRDTAALVPAHDPPDAYAVSNSRACSSPEALQSVASATC